MLRYALSCFLLAVLTNSALAGQMLDARGTQVQKLEVSSSLGGFRNTLIFYTFQDQKAVLKIVIDNKSTKFPVAATLYTFAENVTEEGLKKWLNNQHSDGLFVDVPEPTANHKIAAGSCKTLSHKFIDQAKSPFGKYDNYSVAFQIRRVAKTGKFRVKDFTDKATVHLKTD
ncbi:MAG: hypothetical protein VX715_07520 [Planctomycetota bacterium]|nr:hypothetical protein [Planctomycetota bacterium]